MSMLDIRIESERDALSGDATVRLKVYLPAETTPEQRVAVARWLGDLLRRHAERILEAVK